MSVSLDDFYVLARTCLVKDEQHFDRFDLAFAQLLQGRRCDLRRARRDSRGMAAARVRAHLSDEDKRAVEALGGLDKLMETLQAAARRAARASPGRQRSGSAPAARARSARTATTRKASASGSRRRLAQRGQGLGRAQFPQSRRRRRAQHAQHQGRAAAAAPFRARRRARGARPGRDDRRARRATPAGSTSSSQPERRNRVKVLLFLDVGGSMDPHVEVCEELFSAAKIGVPSSRALLLPQLRLRSRVARQRAPAQRALQHARTAAHLRSRLEGDLRRRRGDESLRADRAGGGSVEYAIYEPGIAWLKRLFEHFPARRLVESGAGARPGSTRARRRCPAAARSADVPADARRHRARASTRCGIDAAPHHCLCPLRQASSLAAFAQRQHGRSRSHVASRLSP